MVLIHLAKMTILQTSCQVFGPVRIPRRVQEEVLVGKEEGYPDAAVVEQTIDEGALEVVDLDEDAEEDLTELEKLNVRGGEAHAVALCWQEGVDRLATDDDNVRNKQELLGIRCVGTPAILLGLFKRGAIDEGKVRRALDVLERVGWFSQAVLDKVRMEVERWEKR